MPVDENGIYWLPYPYTERAGPVDAVPLKIKVMDHGKWVKKIVLVSSKDKPNV